MAVQLEQRMESFAGILDQFDEIQNEIEFINETETSVEREEFESRYYTLLTNAKLTIEDLSKNKKSGLNDDDTQSQISKSSSQSAKLESVKLPEIKIPKFEGEYYNWLEFRDIFRSLIDNNEYISDIQKYHYLRASLIGTAA
ncbi:hypothetical protein HUJ05_012226 [Dendroctonus ponderosae]|nr:hypothetical protein HUJ05_012226 [Dendroctonus ponderosae]